MYLQITKFPAFINVPVFDNKNAQGNFYDHCMPKVRLTECGKLFWPNRNGSLVRPYTFTYLNLALIPGKRDVSEQINVRQQHPNDYIDAHFHVQEEHEGHIHNYGRVA